MTQEFQDLYARAEAAGKEAAEAVQVTPMVVYSGMSIFDRTPDITKPVYQIDDGVCGFASIHIKPANSKFANWLKANKLAQKDYFRGGLYIWVSDYNQSMTRKEAYATAFAEVLVKAGYKAYAESRLD